MNNIEYSLMAIVLNYPEKFKLIRNNIFLQDKTKKLYDILLLKESFNKAIILEIIQADNSFEVDDLEEIYNYYYEVDEFKNYYDQVYANYLRFFFYESSRKMLNLKELTAIEIKQNIQKIINDVSIDEEGEIICCQEVLKEMLKSEGQVCKLVESDIDYFDRWGGFECDDFIILAARANVGKTTTAINMINVNLGNNKKVGFFSLESNRKKIMSIMACSAAGVEELKYRINALNEQEKVRLYGAFEKLYEKKFYIDDTSNLDVEGFKRKVRIMKGKYNIDICYLDYIQYLNCYDKRYSSIREQIIYISKSIKQLCRELQIPIIALAQLNRENEKEKREPRKSDLKESGSLEQDSDIIILLHPENPDDEKVKIKNIVAKGRNIPTGYYYTYYEKKIRRITEIKGNYV